MLYTRIKKNKLVTILSRVEWEILKLHRTAVKTHEMTGLSENRGKLIHDTALHTAVVMLSALTDTSKLELIDTELEKLIKSKSESTLKSSRR
jgi:hypothetical protein